MFISIETIKKNTAFKTKKRAKAARDTLQWLIAGAPHHGLDHLDGEYGFNMTQFISEDNQYDDYQKNSCQTACCLGGAIHLIENSGNKENFPCGANLEEMLSYFDFDEYDRENQLTLLFLCKSKNMDYEMEYVTPHMAALVLLDYMMTGSVSWNLVFNNKNGLPKKKYRVSNINYIEENN